MTRTAIGGMLLSAMWNFGMFTHAGDAAATTDLSPGAVGQTVAAPPGMTCVAASPSVRPACA